jgi:predicted RNA-binding Zn-ribbon protein involved in translation (DUF1610 family)
MSAVAGLLTEHPTLYRCDRCGDYSLPSQTTEFERGGEQYCDACAEAEIRRVLASECRKEAER